jgi:hypothetical protein
MRDDEIAEVRAALEEVGNIISGDPVTLVDPSGDEPVEIDLICIMEDLAATDTAAKDDGVRSDEAGWKVGSVKRLTFWKSHLAENQATIDPSKHFMIGGVRYDLRDKEPIRDSVVPLAGIQNLLEVIVRKSVELNSSTSGEFSYTPPADPEETP